MNRLVKHVVVPFCVALNAVAALWLAGTPITPPANAAALNPIEAAVALPAETSVAASRALEMRRLLTFPSITRKACRGVLCARRNG